jgi:hypothetical protein
VVMHVWLTQKPVSQVVTVGSAWRVLCKIFWTTLYCNQHYQIEKKSLIKKRYIKFEYQTLQINKLKNKRLLCVEIFASHLQVRFLVDQKFQSLATFCGCVCSNKAVCLKSRGSLRTYKG